MGPGLIRLPVKITPTSLYVHRYDYFHFWKQFIFRFLKNTQTSIDCQCNADLLQYLTPVRVLFPHVISILRRNFAGSKDEYKKNNNVFFQRWIYKLPQSFSLCICQFQRIYLMVAHCRRFLGVVGTDRYQLAVNQYRYLTFLCE